MHLTRVLRRLIRFPAFTVVAVFTLAIGIGANSAIFSVVYGVLLKPLPYPRPDELVAVDHSAPGVNLKSAGAAPFLYFTYRDQAKSFGDVGMWQGDTVSVTGLASPEEIPVVDVTGGVLPILGVKPALGRRFTSVSTLVQSVPILRSFKMSPPPPFTSKPPSGSPTQGWGPRRRPPHDVAPP
jgi:hypothetical protein